jgi:hypothetical protein
MAKPVASRYTSKMPETIKALMTVIARLGYTLGTVDKENGLIAFETGKSMSSWAGQSMSVLVIETDNESVEITIGGTMKAHGDQLQVYDWGEASKIAKNIFLELDKVLGKGSFLQEGDSGACFVATAVYGDYDHPQVKKLRLFRDITLSRSIAGRLFIQIYYTVGPSLAFIPLKSLRARSLIRSFLDLF